MRSSRRTVRLSATDLHWRLHVGRARHGSCSCSGLTTSECLASEHKGGFLVLSMFGRDELAVPALQDAIMLRLLDQHGELRSQSSKASRGRCRSPSQELPYCDITVNHLLPGKPGDMLQGLYTLFTGLMLHLGARVFNNRHLRIPSGRHSSPSFHPGLLHAHVRTSVWPSKRVAEPRTFCM